MRSNTERKGKRLAPILCAAVAVLFFAGLLLLLAVSLLEIGSEEGIAIGMLVLYGVILLALIVGVLVALGQRLRELRNGEEDDARKY